jgi:uncharacterized protein YbjT (DUF2867 family)
MTFRLTPTSRPSADRRPRGVTAVTVLVTGATGRLGPHVVRDLLDRGCSVQALTRRSRADLAGMLPEEVTLVHGDLEDLDRLRDLLGAVEDVVLITPHAPAMGAVQMGVIEAARATGTRVIKVSGTSSGIRPDGPDACRQHWQVEQHLADSGLPFAVLRPNGFMQTLLAGVAGTVRSSGRLINPLGAAGISIVDCADVGRAIGAVTVDRSTNGRTFVLTGPAAPTYRQIAESVGEVTGHEVQVVDVSPQEAGAAARERGLSPWEAEHLAEMLGMFATGASEYVTGDVEELTGRRPASAREWIATHRELFVG